MQKKKGDNGYRSRACARTRPRTHAVTNLPARGTVAVSLVLEVRHALDHPVVDLRQGQPLLGRALDGLGDQVGV